MANTIISIRSSGVVGNTPSTLQPGELAINYADGKLYYGNSTSQVEIFSAGAATEPAGLNGEIQFNSFGSFGSSGNFSYDTANNVLIVPNILVGTINVSPSIVFASATANTANQRAVTSGTYANAAYTQANTATTNAATADQRAVTSGVYANSAFSTANTASVNATSAGSYANGAFTRANTANTNAATADQRAVTSGLYANAAFVVANTASANSISAGSYANGAFNQANTANTNAATADQRAVTSGSYANSAFGIANTTSVNALSAGSYANSAYIQANTATTNAATADQRAVTSGVYANAAYTQANTASINAISAGSYANGAFNTANTANTYFYGVNATQNTNITTANNNALSAGSYANSAYLQANTAITNAATADQRAVTSGVYANAAFGIANTASINATSAGSYANGAFTRANTDVTSISVVANTYGNASHVTVTTLAANGRVSLITNTAIVIDTAAITSGTLAVARGGTGVTTSTGTGAVVLGTAPTITLPTINNIRTGYSTTVTAAGTTILTVNSNYLQFFTGTTTQILSLPAPQTMTLGMGFFVVNNSTGSIEVRAANAATVATVLPGTAMLFVSVDLTAGNGAAGWSAEIVGFSTITGTGAVVLNTSPTLSTPTVNRIDWPASGTGAPTFTTRSAGTKLLVYPAINGSQVDYAMGIDSATLWSSVPVNSSSFYFKWYGGTTNITSLDGTGAFTTSTINVYSTTASTSNTTGALTVLGGIGAKGNVYADAFYSGGTEVLTFAQAGFNQANTATTNAATADQRAVTSGTYANTAFGVANTASINATSAGSYANGAFNQANTADQRAVTSGLYANSAYAQANTATTNAATADQKAVSAGVYANSAFGVANTASVNATSAGSYANGAFTLANTANQRAVTSGTYANAAYTQANTATTNAATADQRAVTSGVYANAAFSTANTKYNSSGGTISGDVNITGNLNVVGATITHSANSFVINDPLILLANNNPGNVLDTGFISHYVEGGVTKHTGLVRDSSANTYYLFDSYVPHLQETNTIDPNEATLRITTLRSNLVSDLVLVRGYDVVNHTNNSYTQANTATTNAATADQRAVTSGTYANAAFGVANTAATNATSAGSYANGAYTQANTATTNAATADQKAVSAGSYANAAFGIANTAATNALSAGSYANGAFGVANTANQRAVTSGVYANAAYTQANTATTNAATADQRAVTSGVYANAAFGVANTASVNATSAGSYANGAFGIANTANQRAVTSGVYANSAYTQANTATTNAATADQRAVTSGVYANSAFGVANTASVNATSSGVYANASFSAANNRVLRSGDAMTGALSTTGNVFAQVLYANTEFYAGIATYSATLLPNALGQFTGNSNTYIQVNQQNIDPQGTSDYVLTADVGNDTSFYVDLGITNSQYNNQFPNNSLGTSVSPLDGYLVVKGSSINQLGGNLVIGTTSTITPTEVRVIVGGVNDQNVVSKFTQTGLQVNGVTTISSNSTTDALRITQLGTGNALRVEDSANPDSTPFVITSAGDVGIGTTSPSSPLTVYNATSSTILLSGDSGTAFIAARSSNDTTAPGLNFRKYRGTTATPLTISTGDSLGNSNYIGYDGSGLITAAQITGIAETVTGTGDISGALTFLTRPAGTGTSATERMRIRSDGNIGFGGVGSSSINFNQQKNITGGINAYAHAVTATVSSDVTSAAFGYYTGLSTAVTSFTVGNLRHYTAFQNALGAGSAITNQFGFTAGSSLIGATNNYGFYGDIASGTGRWNFYAAGTADNYFAGNVGIGISPTSKLHVSGSTKVGGILVEDSSTSAAAPAIEVIGKRSDANDSSAFSGKLLLAGNRTDAAVATNKVLGTLAFGGNHTDGTLANILYSASIVGISEGAFSNATTMPTALVFYTGATGRSPDTANITVGTERLRIGNTGIISLGATPGAESLRVTPVASAVNYWDAIGSATGNSIGLYARGSDANVGMNFVGKGTGQTFFNNNGVNQFSIGNTASAVNYLQVTGGATTGGPSLLSQGSDTNVDLLLKTKGTGTLNFYTNSGTLQFLIGHTASAVNYVQVTGGATGSAITIAANGTDTNVGMSYISKGAGQHFFYSSGSPQFNIGNTASAVNYIQVSGGATGSAASLSAQGTDANVPLSLLSKGTGDIRFTTNAVERMRIDSAGTVGIGVVPSAWSTYKVLQIGNTALFNASAAATALAHNYFWNGSASLYINDGFASAYTQLNGIHRWISAPSGTAGTPSTLTEKMRIDASGNVGIGTSTPSSTLGVNGTVTATAFSGRLIGPELLDDVSGLTDSVNCVFTMKLDGVPVSNTYIIDSKDLQVTVDGRILRPYIEDGDFIFMPAYDAYKGFRVRDNRVIIYNAPEVGSQIDLVAQYISTTKQIRRYPFSATNIGLGD
jgi:hypothetical protein